MTTIDFSLLPAPNVIEEIDFEVILQALKDHLILLDPALEAVILESEPLTKLLEVYAYREVILRQRVNDGANAVMLAYATGSDLDNLGAFYGVVRLEISPADDTTVPPTPAVLESDDAFRDRIVLGLDVRTTAGARNTYISFALAANADVFDVSVESPTPGVVVLSVLSRSVGGIPDQSVLDDVFAAVNADDVRPLTDNVQVQAVTIVNYNVLAVLTVYPGPDPVTVLAEANAAVLEYVNARYKLDNDVTRSGLIAACTVSGVQNVELTDPAADVVITPAEAPLVGTIGISIGGTAV